MSKKTPLADFNATIEVESNLGNKFKNNFTTQKDATIALLATIEYLGFVAKQAGCSEQAEARLLKGIKDDESGKS